MWVKINMSRTFYHCDVVRINGEEEYFCRWANVAIIKSSSQHSNLTLKQNETTKEVKIYSSKNFLLLCVAESDGERVAHSGLWSTYSIQLKLSSPMGLSLLHEYREGNFGGVVNYVHPFNSLSLYLCDNLDVPCIRYHHQHCRIFAREVCFNEFSSFYELYSYTHI